MGGGVIGVRDGRMGGVLALRVRGKGGAMKD